MDFGTPVPIVFCTSVTVICAIVILLVQVRGKQKADKIQNKPPPVSDLIPDPDIKNLRSQVEETECLLF